MKKSVENVNTKKVVKSNIILEKPIIVDEPKIIESIVEPMVTIVDLKVSKKQEQNKRVWLSCEKKGHFGCMVPSRYLVREGVREKLRCPICGEILKLKEDRKEEILELAANKK